MNEDRERLEWLETDGRGGFASGTALGTRTRRYHALLLVAARPPVDRYVLVNGLDAWVDVDGAVAPITTQRYSPDVLHPDGSSRIVAFDAVPWPTWRIRIAPRLELVHEILVDEEGGATLLSWKLASSKRKKPVTLFVRLFLSGRDFHAMHHENRAFQFEPVGEDGALTWRPYDGVPGVRVEHSGVYEHDPQWYRNFLYVEERARGLDAIEDLASPGTIRWDLTKGEATCVLRAVLDAGVTREGGEDRGSAPAEMRARERKRRASFEDPLERSARAYVVRRGQGKTIIAGYPWFGDWGRDTFVALRGLSLATGRLGEARDVLLEWAGALDRGMIPNRFPDHGEAPEFNSVDASLWFVIAAGDLLARAPANGLRLSPLEEERLQSALLDIVEQHAQGTRHRIMMGDTGLLKAGEPGLQLTWMDARVGDRVVTPRIGKPVEVQALWLNALHIASRWNPKWKEPFELGRTSFEARFWNEDLGCLHDVVDVEHQPGVHDDAIRPNQILAVGGLPIALLEGKRARSVVDVVERELWTPMGLRTLGPREPGYHGRYEGGVTARDEAYHQGTVWPFLLGAFVDAWVRVRGRSDEAKREARERFVQPMQEHLQVAGIGHVSEIADGDPPHTPRGCPFQAWSLGELIRLEREIVAEASPPSRARGPKPAASARAPRLKSPARRA